MPILPDWRSSTEIDALQHLERPGFAWEFLRRNSKYRADYERIVGAGKNDKPEVAKAAASFARHWGLICTDGPKTSGYRGDGAMAPGNIANRSHSDACARRLRQSGIARLSRFGGRDREMGHRVKLIPPQYVKPFVKRNKNDRNDAEATRAE